MPYFRCHEESQDIENRKEGGEHRGIHAGVMKDWPLTGIFLPIEVDGAVFIEHFIIYLRTRERSQKGHDAVDRINLKAEFP